MHVRETVELAGWIATQRHLLLANPAALGGVALDDYWAASRCRLDEWSRALKKHSARLPHGSIRERHALWRLVQPVLEEILTSEILSRVWAAVCCASEARVQADEASPVVRNVLMGHLAARSRAMDMMVNGEGMPVEDAVRLNRLRRRNERWTDLLLSLCDGCSGVEAFAFRRSRLREFQASACGATAESLILASLRTAYHDGLSVITPNAGWNERVAGAILHALSDASFDPTGLPKSVSLHRIAFASADTQGTLEDVLPAAEPPLQSPPGTREFYDWARRLKR